MAYTYLIGWSKYDKYYYGVRFSKKSSPSELWVSYFTSSKYVKKFAKKHGNPDIVQIRRVFDSSKKAILWETKVLLRMNVLKDDRWLNKTNNKAIDPDCAKHGWSFAARKNASIAHTGKKRSESHRKAISESLKGRYCDWLIGKTRPDHSEKMSGKNNPRSIQVLYDGKIYDTLKDLSIKENISYHTIRKMINSQEIKQMDKELRHAL